MKTVNKWSREVTKSVRRSRPVRRAEERFGVRRPPLPSRAAARALIRAIESAQWHEAA